jgi:hypothetical protein
MDLQPSDGHLVKGRVDISLGPNDSSRHVRAPRPQRTTTARLLAGSVMAKAPLAVASGIFVV